jgi:hypothetical protein
MKLIVQFIQWKTNKKIQGDLLHYWYFGGLAQLRKHDISSLPPPI